MYGTLSVPPEALLTYSPELLAVVVWLKFAPGLSDTAFASPLLGLPRLEGSLYGLEVWQLSC